MMTRSVDGYALGRFDDGAGPFTGLVVGERVLRLQDDGLVKGPATYQALLGEWPPSRPGCASWPRS